MRLLHAVVVLYWSATKGLYAWKSTWKTTLTLMPSRHIHGVTHFVEFFFLQQTKEKEKETKKKTTLFSVVVCSFQRESGKNVDASKSVQWTTAAPSMAYRVFRLSACTRFRFARIRYIRWHLPSATPYAMRLHVEYDEENVRICFVRIRCALSNNLIVHMRHTSRFAQAPTIRYAAVFSFIEVNFRCKTTIKIKLEHETICSINEYNIIKNRLYDDIWPICKKLVANSRVTTHSVHMYLWVFRECFVRAKLWFIWQ